MSIPPFRARALALCFCIAIGPMAQAVTPSVAAAIPPGGQRGTQAVITFTGGNLGDAVDLMFHEPGISLAGVEVKDGNNVACTLDIAPDCRIGAHGIRVRTSSGVSNVTLFSVGALPEIEEAEPNDTFEAGQAIELNTTINGVIPNEDVDYFVVTLEEGQRLAVEIQALRLGIELFDPKLRLFGPGGHERVAVDDTAMMRQDAAFVYTATEAGPHRIAVSEASYGGSGNYRYRLHVGNFPRPLGALPFGGQAEQPLDLRWLGDPALASQSVAVPASVRPATLEVVPESESGVAPTPVPFRVGPHPGVNETEPNNEAAAATPGAAPGSFNGVIQEAGDVDMFSFAGTAGQVYDIRVWARALGSPLDSVLTLLGPDGAAVAADDDAAGVDSTLRATLPADGTYTIHVRDHLNRGGETFAYRVEANPVVPSLTLGVRENEEVLFPVAAGNQHFMVLTAQRSEFDGNLAVEWPNLPEGLTVEAGTFAPGQTELPVLIRAAATLAPQGVLADVRAKCTDEGVDVAGGLAQNVVLIYGANKTVFQTFEAKHLAMAVTEPAPYMLSIVAPKAPAVPNGNKLLRVQALRADGFTAPINLRFPWLPGNMGGGTAQIPENASEVDINLEVRPGVGIGSHNLVIEGNGGGYILSTPFTPIEITEPWIATQMADVSLEQGQSIEVPVAMTHAREYPGTFKLEWVNLPKGITAEPVDFSHGTAEAKFTLAAAADAPVGKHGAATFVAVIESNGEPVRHVLYGGQIAVFAPLPPELQQAAPPPAEEKKADEPARKTRFGTG